MIKTINIPNFGSFKNFDWNTSLRDAGNNVVNFKKLNIFYGRNYSGKTTLSRIIRSLETGKLPDKFDAPSFDITTSTNTINQSQIPDSTRHIRVYNKDFVNENLSFLHDAAGRITPFAIVGSDNNLIESEIELTEKQLGNVDEKTGLRFQHAIKHGEFVAKKGEVKRRKDNLRTKLTNKANSPSGGIKHNTLYRDPNYNTPKIEEDIKRVRKQSVIIFEPKEVKKRQTLLDEVALPDIKEKIQFTSSFTSLYIKTKELCTKKITPNEPIRELLDDAILQNWVKEGMPYHRGKRTQCGFCGQQLPADLWKKLDEHFSKESSELEVELNTHKTNVKTEIEQLDQLISLDDKHFYSSLQPSFIEAKQELTKEIKSYKKSLESIAKVLEKRSKEIFTPQETPSIMDNTVTITEKVQKTNILIDTNNRKTESLEDDQKTARDELRLNEVAQFIKDIDMDKEEREIADLEVEAAAQKEKVEELYRQIKDLEIKVSQLKIKLKDERKGAERVNDYLNHYFGHNGLRLEAVEEGDPSAFKFQILRGQTPAYNLSEGECSLVAFCYFIAKLEDSESKGKELIIYIDDPISSLDSNHIFFIFSLIENLIAKPLEDADGNVVKNANNKPEFRYEQLFISTHNLEFLKYLKKLSRPSKDHEQFIVVGKDSGSVLEVMPSYLKNYITEFNYLFGEIYICSDPTNAATKYHCFYNFGNNLRKFLEAFLFFKYPFTVSDQRDYNQRIEHFFKADQNSAPLVQRITNEYSHLGEVFDRGTQPIDCDEISKVAKFVLRKIRENDIEQYKYLLQSIDRPDPFEETQVAASA